MSCSGRSFDPLTPQRWGLVLCAGGSTRMGEPKALLELDGEPLVAAHVRGLAGCCDRVAVVLGAHREAILRAVPATATVVVNDAWENTTMSDSVRCAVQGLQISHDLVVTPVDVLPASRTTLAALCEGRPPAAVAAGGRRGHPVRLGPVELQRVRSGPLPGGLRDLLHQARTVEVEDPTVVGDFDVPAAWQEARRRWVGRSGPTG